MTLQLRDSPLNATIRNHETPVPSALGVFHHHGNDDGRLSALAVKHAVRIDFLRGILDALG